MTRDLFLGTHHLFIDKNIHIKSFVIVYDVAGAKTGELIEFNIDKSFTIDCVKPEFKRIMDSRNVNCILLEHLTWHTKDSWNQVLNYKIGWEDLYKFKDTDTVSELIALLEKM